MAAGCAEGKIDQAVTVLEKALSLAEPEGYVRIFVDEGEHIGEQTKKRSGAETKSDSEPGIQTAGETGNESQGGDEEKFKSLRGRRIDLRA